jgi:phosphoribosyl-AMP cyclohydrolase
VDRRQHLGEERHGAADAASYHRVMPAIAVREDDLDHVRYDEKGLVPAIVQEHATGTVLMMAWMTAETLGLSLAEGRTVFWSRSRQEVWRKGDTSGEVQRIRSAHYDCDGDTLLFVVDQDGQGACHTGRRSCFYRAFGVDGDRPAAGAPR